MYDYSCVRHTDISQTHKRSIRAIRTFLRNAAAAPSAKQTREISFLTSSAAKICLWGS